MNEEDKLERAALSAGESYFAALRKWDSTFDERITLRLKWEAACQAMIEFKAKRRETVG